jgi:hypothetical protein
LSHPRHDCRQLDIFTSPFRRSHAAVRRRKIESQPCSSASPPLITFEEQLDRQTQAGSTHLTSSPLSCTVPLRTVSSVTIDKIPQPCYGTRLATAKSKAHTLVKKKCSLPPRAAKGNMSMKYGNEIFLLDIGQFPFSASPSRGSGRVPADQFYKLPFAVRKPAEKHVRAVTEELVDSRSRIASYVRAR